MVWCSMKKECMTRLRPSHRVLDCLVDLLSSRRWPKLRTGTWGWTYEWTWGYFPEHGRIQYGVPNGVYYFDSFAITGQLVLLYSISTVWGYTLSCSICGHSVLEHLVVYTPAIWVSDIWLSETFVTKGFLRPSWYLSFHFVFFFCSCPCGGFYEWLILFWV